MPDKSHRAAARQGQVQRRRRRTKAGPQSFDAGPGESSRAHLGGAEDEALRATAGGQSVARAPQPSALGPVSRRRRAAQAEATYPYLGRELRRIGVFMTLVVLVLVALTFVLR